MTYAKEANDNWRGVEFQYRLVENKEIIKRIKNSQLRKLTLKWSGKRNWQKYYRKYAVTFSDLFAHEFIIRISLWVCCHKNWGLTVSGTRYLFEKSENVVSFLWYFFRCFANNYEAIFLPNCLVNIQDFNRQFFFIMLQV